MTKASDYYSARQWHSTGMYTDYLRPHGTEHELLMLLPAGPGPAAGPGRTVRLPFSRGPAPDFFERDRALLALLRPHLPALRAEDLGELADVGWPAWLRAYALMARRSSPRRLDDQRDGRASVSTAAPPGLAGAAVRVASR